MIPAKKHITMSKARTFFLEHVMQAEEDNTGFCILCGNEQSAEPDARGYECDNCGKKTVYGALEIALMGLTR